MTAQMPNSCKIQCQWDIMMMIALHCLFPGSTLQQAQQHHSARALFLRRSTAGPSPAQHIGNDIMQPSKFPPHELAAILDIEGQRARIVPSDCWVQVGYCALGGQIT